MCCGKRRTRKVYKLTVVRSCMGRIKTMFIKRKTKELLKAQGDNFTTDFTNNKVTVEKYAKVNCKKVRNIIAGYMTRLKKAEQASS